jgi:hypothetical protein
MTDEEWAKKIRQVGDEDCDDREEGHYQADMVLCEMLESLGYVKAVEAFRSIKKWYA